MNVLHALPTLQQLRKQLHQRPELSGAEAVTAATLQQFIMQHHPTTIINNLGGHGLAAVYTFGAGGPTVMFRCELDALPIAEANAFAHRSVHAGVSHKCGHDGHMTIVAGLIFWLRQQSFQSGKVILLFQPAEENGQGAHAVINDARFTSLQPDYVFALHNLPGFPLHTVIKVDKAFSATVQSVAIYVKGRQSHASEPEKGINPALALAGLVQAFAQLNVPEVAVPHFALVTPVHLHMGDKAYGISAGAGELHYTLRTWTEGTMQQLKEKINSCITTICAEHGLQVSTEWFDFFPASINNDGCNEVVAATAIAGGYTVQQQPHPFKFGEDFGWFSKRYPSALFGLGAGEAVPALHHNDYDFPDDLIQTGIHLFAGIATQLLGAKADN